MQASFVLIFSRRKPTAWDGYKITFAFETRDISTTACIHNDSAILTASDLSSLAPVGL